MRVVHVIPLVSILWLAGPVRANAQAGTSRPPSSTATQQARGGTVRCDAAFPRSLNERRVDEASLRRAITEKLGASPIDDQSDWSIDGVSMCGREVQLLLHGE